MATDTRTRVFSMVLVVGLLAVAVAAVLLLRRPVEPAAADNPIPIPVPTTTTPDTTAPPAAEPAVEPATERAAQPVDPPRDPYAKEPITEIGVIEIPKIGLRHRLMHGISLRNIDQGPSHWPGTALPGETGNVVIAGHRVTHSKPFRNIHLLVPGDLVHFEVQGIRTTYVVTGSEVVPPTALHIVDQTPTPTGTLFACHPPGSARQRYVVRLALTADEPEAHAAGSVAG